MTGQRRQVGASRGSDSLLLPHAREVVIEDAAPDAPRAPDAATAPRNRGLTLAALLRFEALKCNSRPRGGRR